MGNPHREITISILKDLPDPKVFFFPDIPEEKLKNLFADPDTVPPPDEVSALIETTDNTLVFTKDRLFIFSREDSAPQTIFFSENPHVEKNEEGVFIEGHNILPAQTTPEDVCNALFLLFKALIQQPISFFLEDTSFTKKDFITAGKGLLTIVALYFGIVLFVRGCNYVKDKVSAGISHASALVEKKFLQKKFLEEQSIDLVNRILKKNGIYSRKCVAVKLSEKLREDPATGTVYYRGTAILDTGVELHVLVTDYGDEFSVAIAPN